MQPLSSSENRFAMGSRAWLIFVWYFESENDWCVSKHIKKPTRSTVLSLDWHPNNILLAVGSCDFNEECFLPTLKKWMRSQPVRPGVAKCFSVSWCQSMGQGTRGQLLGQRQPPGLGQPQQHCVHCQRLKSMQVSTLKVEFLPLLSVSFVSENSIVAAGHDCCPMLFN